MKCDISPSFLSGYLSDREEFQESVCKYVCYCKRVNHNDCPFPFTLGSHGDDDDADLLATVKMLDKRHIIREKKVQYVSREKEVLTAIDHPFFVKLYFTFQDADHLCILLLHVGSSLRIFF